MERVLSRKSPPLRLQSKSSRINERWYYHDMESEIINEEEGLIEDDEQDEF